MSRVKRINFPCEEAFSELHHTYYGHQYFMSEKTNNGHKDYAVNEDNAK